LFSVKLHLYRGLFVIVVPSMEIYELRKWRGVGRVIGHFSRL
jgi:hypothetical protein